MRKILILSAAVALAACGDRVQLPGNTPAAEVTPDQPGKGGPCGDGTVLRPGQNCP